MRAALLAALLAFGGCRYDLDKNQADANPTGRACKVTTSSSCMAAVDHSDFTWIKDNIFAANCFGSSCHTGATASGKLDLTDDPYTSLMGPDGMGKVANLDPNHQLVVPGDPAASYLFYIIRGLDADEDPGTFAEPPSSVGFMPMSNATLCCQKIDAIERWITAGAMND